MERNKARAYLLIILSVIFWGFSFIGTNILLQAGIPPVVFLLVRINLAGWLLFAFGKFTKQLQAIERKDWKWLVLLSFCEPFAYFLAETYGLMATGSPTITALVIATIPLFSLLVGRVFFREKLSTRNITGILLTLPGAALMIFNGGSVSAEHGWGILILMIAVLASVSYASLVKTLSDRYNSTTLTTYQFILGGLMFIPLLGTVDLRTFDPAILIQPKIIAAVVSLAVLCSCCAFAFYVEAVTKIGMTRTVVFTALIPAVSAAVSFSIGLETFNLQQVLGIAIVIVGVILSQLSPAPNRSDCA